MKVIRVQEIVEKYKCFICSNIYNSEYNAKECIDSCQRKIEREEVLAEKRLLCIRQTNCKHENVQFYFEYDIDGNSIKIVVVQLCMDCKSTYSFIVDNDRLDMYAEQMYNDIKNQQEETSVYNRETEEKFNVDLDKEIP